MELIDTILLLALFFFVGTSAKLEVKCAGKGENTRCHATGAVDTPKLVQGDMDFGTSADENGGPARNALRDNLWPGGVIPVVLHEEFTDSEKMMIDTAINDIMNETCVTFELWKGVGPAVVITKGPYCYASVGMNLNEYGFASLNLESPGCFSRGLIHHELLHLTGLFHEQSRPDRDMYVTVQWDNIQKEPKDMSHNFAAYTNEQVNAFGLPYNYMSVMHYVNNEFSKDPSLPTLISKIDPGMQLGQRVAAHSLDLEKVRLMYNCPTPMETNK